jgi:hypothetical protein
MHGEGSDGRPSAGGSEHGARPTGSCGVARMAQKEGSGVPRTPVIVSGGGEGSEEETASSPGGGSMFGSSASGTPTRGEGSGV